MESELRNDSHASSSPVAPILSDIEATAVQVALFRWHGAQLLKRPDGSPYYTSHLDELVFGKYLSPEQQREMLGKHYDMVINMAVRTAEIDERLVAATSGAKTGPLVEQVVLVGAGMDTRAWRLGLPPSCTIFEIDTMPDELKLQVSWQPAGSAARGAEGKAPSH